MYPKSSSVSVEKFGSVPDALPMQSCSSQVQRINEGACGKPPAPICNSICCLIRVDFKGTSPCFQDFVPIESVPENFELLCSIFSFWNT